MKTDSISKRVIALVVVGLALAAFILWRGASRQTPSPIETLTVSAPAFSSESNQVVIGKIGSTQLRGNVLKTDGNNIVTLTPPRQVQGQVLNAETGQPVTKFRIGVGHFFVLDHFSMDSSGMKDYTDANGVFTVDLDKEESNGIRADSDDCAEQTQTLPEAENGVIKVVFRLKPSAALQGIVVSPDGTPLPDITVAMVRGRLVSGGVQLKNGRLSSWNGGAKTVTTDASGRFTLPPPPETGGIVVAAGDLGYASASAEDVRTRGGLVLQPFGRIEGMLLIGGNPGAGQDLMFTLGQGVGVQTSSYKSTTDEQGRFSFEKVPASTGSLVRLIKTAPNTRAVSHNKEVIIEPGKTTKVTLGDSGTVLKGNVRFETPPAEGESLAISGNLSTQMPPFPSFNTLEEAQAFINSPEQKELVKQRKHFAVAVNADGSFTVDDVAPGTYTLNVTASKAGSRPFENPPVAQGRATVTIPEGANPYSPINLGEIILKPAPQANVVPRP